MVSLIVRNRCIAVFAAVVCVAAPRHAAFAQQEPQFGTRSAQSCPKVASVPSPAQAAALVQCRQEAKEATRITLLEHVNVQLGGPQPYNFKSHSMLTGVDTESKVYPIRGSYRWYTCVTARGESVNHNCSYNDHPRAAGYCWATTFGDWDCALQGDGGAIVSDQPPPS